MNLLQTKYEIAAKLKENGLIDTKFSFSCYDSFVFTYTHENENLLFEFSFICNDTLLSELTGRELLNLSEISYISLSLYLHEERIYVKFARLEEPN